MAQSVELVLHTDPSKDNIFVACWSNIIPEQNLEFETYLNWKYFSKSLLLR
jgi:hypothetical protein